MAETAYGPLSHPQRQDGEVFIMGYVRATRVPVAEWEAEHGPMDPEYVRRMARQLGTGPLVRAQHAALADGCVLEFETVEGAEDAG